MLCGQSFMSMSVSFGSALLEKICFCDLLFCEGVPQGCVCVCVFFLTFVFPYFFLTLNDKCVADIIDGIV